MPSYCVLHSTVHGPHVPPPKSVIFAATLPLAPVTNGPTVQGPAALW
ncbi:Mycobacterium terramassiliense ORFan [Mycobacterium terramassiliense]|uniref:Mycobacterium terramassiliense ORFan n=1 Tax=Mycobacterium terramassiliense TaxID=1841859 RepID=A0A2U3NFW6_9MYCO|nr:Mycobacterium terramassiliense ORFan [Mycobacterium terramassiliense]